VVSVVGALPPQKEAGLAEITMRVFGGGEDWKATLRATLKLDLAMDASIRGMWERNQSRARDAGVVLTPEEFARMIVDSNFAHLLR